MRAITLVSNMEHVRAFFAHPVIAGVLAIVVAAGLLALLSRIYVLPVSAWALLALALALVMIVIAATGRYLRSRHELQVPLIAVGRGLFARNLDYRPIANFQGGFRDVMWRFHGRVIDGSELRAEPDLDPDTIEVESPPLCPRCQTGLLERSGRIRRFVWSCVGCGWRKGSSERFSTVAPQAELYFQGRWRRELAGRGVLRR
jgi:ribosomal protein L37AE/L43A